MDKSESLDLSDRCWHGLTIKLNILWRAHQLQSIAVNIKYQFNLAVTGTSLAITAPQEEVLAFPVPRHVPSTHEPLGHGGRRMPGTSIYIYTWHDMTWQLSAKQRLKSHRVSGRILTPKSSNLEVLTRPMIGCVCRCSTNSIVFNPFSIRFKPTISDLSCPMLSHAVPSVKLTLASSMTSYSNSPCAGVTMDFPTNGSLRWSHCPVAGIVLKAMEVFPKVSLDDPQNWDDLMWKLWTLWNYCTVVVLDGSGWLSTALGLSRCKKQHFPPGSWWPGVIHEGIWIEDLVQRHGNPDGASSSHSKKVFATT